MLVWGKQPRQAHLPRRTVRKSKAALRPETAAPAFRVHCRFPAATPSTRGHAHPPSSSLAGGAGPRRRCGCCAVRSRAEEPWSQSRECALPTLYSLCLESKAAFPLRFRLGAAAAGHACDLPLHKPRSFWIFPSWVGLLSPHQPPAGTVHFELQPV